MEAVATVLSKIALRSNDYKIYGAGIVQPDPAWRMARHSHSFPEIVALTQGRLLLKSDEEEIMAESGDVLFYRAGFAHAETSDPVAPSRLLYLGFDPGNLLPGLPVRIRDTEGRIRQLMAWIVEDERVRRPAELRTPLLEALLGELRYLSDVSPDPWLEEMLAFIRKHHPASLTLDDLARRGKMSKFAFVRKFKRLCGRTPMGELRLTRLDQARNLLLTTNLPMKAIASAVGLGDEYQLSKLFRSHFDLSPRDLRIRKTAGKRASL
jgi:AraC-like DNA-binding protein